jgi:serine/threonine protein kinase
MWSAQPRLRPSFADVQGELIVQTLSDAAVLVQTLQAAAMAELPHTWHKYTMAQIKPLRTLGTHHVMLQLPDGLMAVAERMSAEDLQAELLVWKTLQHENLAPFLGTCDETGLLLVACQPNGSIRDFLAQRSLSITQRLPMLLQTALGLEFLHTRGILHTRLNASNCLLSADLGVKLSGFSAAGLRLGGGGEPWCCPLARTTNEFSTASDVYSLAATVFEVLAFPVLLPLGATELQAGRGDWPPNIQELLAQCAQQMPDSRPTVGYCVSTLELTVFGEDRWEFAPVQLVLLQELGSGQFGVVNKMAASGITRPGKTSLVAVKQLNTVATPESEAEFTAEMQLMMKLRHPNLVGLVGVVTKTCPLMLILEFLPGGSLDNWLRTPHDASTEDLLYILYQVALGMSGLHALGVMHRDLAARNVLVGVDLNVKVADYGLSREVTDTKEYYKLRSNRPLPLRWLAPEVSFC